jgi:hypothetical protein
MKKKYLTNLNDYLQNEYLKLYTTKCGMVSTDYKAVAVICICLPVPP